MKFVLCVLLAGCYPGEARPAVTAVAPGIAVVNDNRYDDPVFVADNGYWRFRDGAWYRSMDDVHGWVIATPPPRLHALRDPEMYAGYHRHYHSGRYGDPQGYLEARR